MLGKCYEVCIVSLVSYKALGVFLSDLFIYNLLAKSDACEVLRNVVQFL